MKTVMCIEKLLQWAYRDELSKRQTSAAEGIWEKLSETGRLGFDPGHGTAQRYHQFGLPHPDAERIEREIGILERVVINWTDSLDYIAGDLAALVTVNDVERRSVQEKRTVSEWTDKSGERRRHEHRPRDLMLINTINVSALITMHAIRASRPDWYDEPPQPHMVQATKGPHAMVVGECRGRNLYTIGSYCPLRWEPSPVLIVMGRADYAAWYDGLLTLIDRLRLEDFTPALPEAPAAPWLERGAEKNVIRSTAARPQMAVLPIKPERPRAGPPMPKPRHSDVRVVCA